MATPVQSSQSAANPRPIAPSLAGSYAGGWARIGSPADYFALTKPRVMTLLLLTGFCAMVAGAGGLPTWPQAAGGMVGLALACGGASALNHVLDADIDRLMGPRTRGRPVAAGRLAKANALRFGLVLSVGSFVLLAATVNLLAATLALAGNLFYVLVYTRWLKRVTPQNIVIGGVAGAVPALVGWPAATGQLAPPAFFLFAIVFLWTPPHFWALALVIKKNYAAAGVPMLPVVRGERETSKQILRYSLALVVLSLAPVATGFFGPVYLLAALALGLPFVTLALPLWRRTTAARAARLFRYSLVYLALLFSAAALDRVLA
jgi:heme o synthase